ncbi:MAG: hypothetical protein ISR85_05395 [Kiritimatiellales bacterium]|nr:hypothetical protein [Kiritimatiellales bacterium]
MKKLRVAIVDFAHDEGYLTERLLGFVSDQYEFEQTEDNPDFVLHSCFGRDVLKFDGVRIFFSAENCSPDFNISDYALGMERMTFGDRFFRLPLYRLYSNTYPALLKPRLTEDSQRSEFCTCVVSNSEREAVFTELFQELSAYRRVASGGGLFNNVGGRVPDKVEFMRSGRFGLAIENTMAPGYITEKITDVFAAGAIPIYWGAPDISLDFNPKAFVNVADFLSVKDAVKEIKAIDQDEDRYRAMLTEPVFAEGAEPDTLKADHIAEFLCSIFDAPCEAAFRRNRMARGRRYEKALLTAFFKPHVQASRLFRSWARGLRNSRTFVPPPLS